MAERRLEGKVALIIGGTSGIGKATARLFIKHGAKVCIADIHDELGGQMLRSLGDGAHAQFIRCDVTKEDDISRAVDFAVATFGTIDIRVNNVEVNGNFVPDIREFELEEFKKVFEANLNGIFLGMKHAARIMVPRRKGSLISISGGGSNIVGGPDSHSYTGSQHAIVGLTKSLAEILGKHGIRVNCISPYTHPANLTPPQLAAE